MDSLFLIRILIRVLGILFIAAGCVNLDDYIKNHKEANWIRLFFGVSLILWGSFNIILMEFYHE